jgi:hypothetical protein
MTLYDVKSRAGLYQPFQLPDNGLGYLTSNIYRQIALAFYGPVGVLIGCPREYPHSDIRVRKVGTKRWRQIKYRRGSSESYLV